MNDAVDEIISPPVRDGLWWHQCRGEGPVLATAIHDGHGVRCEVREAMALPDADRLREEDPFTGHMIADVANRVVVHRSRFEVDLNRAPELAVYVKPEQSWGLRVWRAPPAEALVARSLDFHAQFYAMLGAMLAGLAATHGRFAVLDVHTYNHRRGGPDAPPTDAAAAPEVNIGTFSMPRDRWAHVLEPVIETMRGFDFRGRRLDVRENVAFQGKGELARFVHANFPDSGCAIAIEFKKFFMDEWTGKPDPDDLHSLRSLVNAVVPVAEQALRMRA